MIGRLLFALVIVFAPAPAWPQTPPTPDEVAGYSGLHRAAYDGDVAAIRAALAEGADPDLTEAKLRTPAHVAAFASEDAALRALAEGGADLALLDDERYDVITIAAVADDPEMVALAIELGALPDLITSIYDGTALIAAAHLGHHAVVRHLIDGGAPLDHVNNLGWTALIEAVILGDGGPAHQATVRALVEAGADASIADRSGLTPLAHAERRGYDAIADLIRASR